MLLHIPNKVMQCFQSCLLVKSFCQSVYSLQESPCIHSCPYISRIGTRAEIIGKSSKGKHAKHGERSQKYTVQGPLQGLFVQFARVGSGDPVRILHLFHNKYSGYCCIHLLCKAMYNLSLPRLSANYYGLPTTVQLRAAHEPMFTVRCLAVNCSGTVRYLP